MTSPELVAIQRTADNPQFFILPLHIAPGPITRLISQKTPVIQGPNEIHEKMQYIPKESQKLTYLYQWKSGTFVCMGMVSTGVRPDGRNMLNWATLYDMALSNEFNVSSDGWQ